VVQTEIGRKQIPLSTKEANLAKYCLAKEERFFRLREVRRMADQIPIRNGMANPFSKDSEEAGRRWTKELPKGKVSVPETVCSREQSFIPETISRFLHPSEPAVHKPIILHADSTTVMKPTTQFYRVSTQNSWVREQSYKL